MADKNKIAIFFRAIDIAIREEKNAMEVPKKIEAVVDSFFGENWCNKTTFMNVIFSFVFLTPIAKSIEETLLTDNKDMQGKPLYQADHDACSGVFTLLIGLIDIAINEFEDDNKNEK